MNIIAKTLKYVPANVDTDFIVEAQAMTQNVALTLAHSNCNSDGLAHQLDFDCSGDINATVFTIVGTDADGLPQKETVTGVTTTLIETVKYWLTVTSITPDATSVETVTVGFVDEFVTPTVVLDPRAWSSWHLDVTGTLSIDTDWSVGDTQRPGTAAVAWLDGSGVESALDAETADSSLAVRVENGYMGMRFRFNSYTNTATLTVYMTQHPA